MTLLAIVTYNNYKNIVYRESAMPDTLKKTRYFLDIDPDLRNHLKAFAALKGKTMKDWVTEAIIAKLEDEVDASEGLASLADTEGTMFLEAYLESRQGKSKEIA